MEEQGRERETTLTFPLTSKRLQLHHVQLILEGLSLPTAASASDLSVMISGRLCENNHDPSNTQIVITQSEEGEELSLQDMNGVFLRIPAPECTSGTPSVSSSELSVELQDVSVLQENNGFSAEEHCLEQILSSMEQELVKARTKLLETQEEVAHLTIKVSDYNSKLLEVQRELGLEREKVVELTQEKDTLQQQLSTSELQSLKEEVKRGQEKVVELWHTNCYQLLTHDTEMFEKEREIKVLCDRLHKAEMELATLKLERLSAGTYPSVSHSTTTNIVGPIAGGVSLNPLGPGGQDNKPVITSLPEWSGGLVTTRQSTLAATMLPQLQPGIHAATTTATNIQPTLLSDLRVVPPIQSSQEQGYYGMSNLMDSASNPRMSFTIQPKEQVTSASTTLSSAFFTSRPVSSAGEVTTGTFTTTAAPWSHDQSQCCCGKAPPIDEFTGEDRWITFDDWLPILERAAIWNGWTQDELLMQLTGYLRGRALQEWKLLDLKDKTTYHSTVTALRE